MSKELPYFRNTVQEWQNGKISTMPFSCKGLFWDICNYYWAQNCKVTEEMLFDKFKSSIKTIQKLIEKPVIYNQNGIISISFLDEQLSELNQTKSKFSKWGKLGQKVKKSKAPLKTDLSYKDKDKDKEKEKDNITSVFSFDDFWEMYGKKTGRAKAEQKYRRIPESDRAIIKEKVPDYVESTPEIQFRKNPLTWLNGECWNDEIILTKEQQNERRLRELQERRKKREAAEAAANN